MERLFLLRFCDFTRLECSAFIFRQPLALTAFLKIVNHVEVDLTVTRDYLSCRDLGGLTHPD